MVSTKMGQALWDRLAADPLVLDPRSPFVSRPWGLFGQSVLAFDAGAYPATSLLCRAVLEAAFFIFLTWVPVEGAPGELTKGTFRVHRPINRKGKPVRLWFETIIGHMEFRGVLSKKQIRNVRRIKEDGDAIAHLAEHEIEVLEPKSGKSTPTRLWITRKMAKRDLGDTAEILQLLSRVVAKMPQRMGPPKDWMNP